MSVDVDELSAELTLAGVGVRLRARGPVALDRFAYRFGPYASPGVGTREGALTLHFELVSEPGIPQPAEVAWPGALGWIEDGVVRFRRRNEEVRFDPRAREGRVRTSPVSREVAIDSDQTPFDTALRLVLSYVLPTRGGLLAHASGYGDERGAVVFMARSGGGKTTTARKLPHANVLSDDQVALLREPGSDGAWHAESLPFVGLYALPPEPRRAPLRALVLLSHGAPGERTLRRCGGAAALAGVAGCLPVFVRGDGGSAARVLELAADLTARVPVYALAIGREVRVASLLDELLGGP